MPAGMLFVVATPIGNLEDVTLRALRVLREADVIAAEDTRRTARLLAHHGIATATVSFHEHNSKARIPQLLARLQAGERVALVTDAGTPGVSDPGIDLVRACVEASVPVDAIPGASAPLAAVVLSGFPMDPFTIFGFPPPKGTDRKTWFATVSAVQWVFVFFESPHRIGRTLSDAIVYLGTRQIVVARELTKLHQEVLRGTAAELVDRVSSPRGEYTLVVGPVDKLPDINTLSVSDDDLIVEFGQMEEITAGRRAAVSALARKHGRPAREVYAALERAKKPPL